MRFVPIVVFATCRFIAIRSLPRIGARESAPLDSSNPVQAALALGLGAIEICTFAMDSPSFGLAA